MRAFSLVELSIVLVILGLLTGGILTGQSLIRAAELRAVGTEYQQYATAVNVFKDKYFATPGDMANATRFWGAQDGGDGLGADCTTVASTSALTCNGTGDGIITPGWYEVFRTWQHLANAGLISGSYSGVAGPVSGHEHVEGVNCPAGKMSNSGWTFYTLNHPGDGGHYRYDYGNTFIFGGLGDFVTQEHRLNAEEAWNIDTKLDDGRPGTGKIFAIANINNVASCIDATTNTDYDSDYRLTIRNQCAALFMMIR